MQEDEIVGLKRKIEALKGLIGAGDDEVSESAKSQELEKLETENAKLKYQIETLKRVKTFSFCTITCSFYELILIL